MNAPEAKETPRNACRARTPASLTIVVTRQRQKMPEQADRRALLRDALRHDVAQIRGRFDVADDVDVVKEIGFDDRQLGRRQQHAPEGRRVLHHEREWRGAHRPVSGSVPIPDCKCAFVHRPEEIRRNGTGRLDARI
jgi:hypothetical protein